MTRDTERLSYRVLVVDDNPAIHGDFRKILCPELPPPVSLAEDEALLFGAAAPEPGPAVFEINSAYQGQQALGMVQDAVAEGRPYALAFVDVRMPPGWDGVETVVQLWRSYPQLQVVICTAYADYGWEEMTRHLGRTDNLVILKKPFDNIEVLQLAHALSQKWHLSLQSGARLESLDHLVRQRSDDLVQANARLTREIEARARTEEALRLSEAHFEKAFRANPLAMAILTRDDARCVDVNERYQALVGLDRESLVGRTPADLAGPLTPELHADLRRRLEGGEAVRDYPCAWQARPLGERRELRLWVESFACGDEPAMLLIVQDVSERARLEMELRQAQRAEAVGQLAAGVAHDFNNLLTVIQGHASLRLSAAQLDKEVRESFEEVSSAAGKAACLTRQLLAFGRRQELRRQPLDLNGLLLRLRERLAGPSDASIEVVYDLAPALPPPRADEAQIEQVLLHVAANAREAMPHGGRLTLHTEAVSVGGEGLKPHPDARAGGYVLVSVKDTGRGMDAATLERIFEPFFSTKEVGQGSGMGLATVYGIVRQHDGWVDVQSQPGQGTTFRVYLPLAKAAASGATPVAPEAAPPTAAPETPRILVVEDEASVRLLVSRVLTRAGYRVETANDGVEALERWRQAEGRFDLVLTDVVMPRGLTGKQLKTMLQAEKPGLKVILTSGHDGGAIDQDQDLKEGYDLLSKPYVIRSLVDTVRARLKNEAGH